MNTNENPAHPDISFSGNRLKPGTLADSLDERIRTALACGALQPIETNQEVVEDSGVRFLVRQVSSLRRKEADKRRRTATDRDRARPENPFLPPEPALTVAEISPTHIAVLNKFYVLDRHLLVVTRRFEHQETLLGDQDVLYPGFRPIFSRQRAWLLAFWYFLCFHGVAMHMK